MNSRLQKYIHTSVILASVFTEGNFSAAAKVLGIQQSAVSHRIKALEDALGVVIFKRSTRALTCTDVGQNLCEAALRGIGQMEKAFNNAMSQKYGTNIRVTTISSLSMKWFIPAMQQAKNNKIDIDLHVQDELVDIAAGEADVAIRFGMGNYDGLYQKCLCPVEVTAVASPAYVQSIDKPDMPFGQASMHLLVDKVAEEQTLQFSWHNYMGRVNANQWEKWSKSEIDRTDLSLQAAISGLGVALGRTLIIEDDIENGFLVPIGPSLLIDASYWLVTSHDFARTAKYKAFERWIQGYIEDST